MAPKSERFEMRLSPEMVKRLDEWRLRQPGQPSRAEAIRRLVHLGLGLQDERAEIRQRLQELNRQSDVVRREASQAEGDRRLELEIRLSKMQHEMMTLMQRVLEMDRLLGPM